MDCFPALQEHLVDIEPRPDIADVVAGRSSLVSPPLYEQLGNSLALQDLPTPVRPVVSRLTQQTLRRRTESTPQHVGTRQWSKYNIKRRDTSAIQQVPRWLSDAEPHDLSGEEVASPHTSPSIQSHPSFSSPPRLVDLDSSGSHSNSESGHSLSKPCDISSSCIRGSTHFEGGRHTRLDFSALSTGPGPLPSILQGQPLVLDTYPTGPCKQYSKELGVIQSTHSTPRRRALTLATDQPGGGGNKPSPWRNRGRKHNDSPLRLDTEMCSLDFIPWDHTSPLTTSGTPHQHHHELHEPRSEGNVAITASNLQYHRKSPTRAPIHEFDTSLPCELCGSLVLRWAILLPCGHRACTACCCSGVNQVSTTPPRPHTCAACQICVTGIALSIPAAQAAQAAAHHADMRYEHSVAATFVDHAARHRFDTSFGGHVASDASIPGIQTGVSMCPILGDATDNETRAQNGLHGLQHVNDKANGVGIHSHNQTRRQQRQVSPEMTFMTDESMVLSEDASFYRPQHVTQLQTAANPSRNASHSQSSTSPGDTRLSALAAPYNYHAVSCDTLVEPCVIRMDNIPWTTSYNDVLSWLPDSSMTLPDREVVPQPVHIPLDLKTGKTANSGFIEVRDADCAKKIIRKRNNTQLMGRPVSLLLSSYDALAVEIFPSYTDWESPTRYVTEQQLAQLVHIIQNGAPQLKDAIKPIELLVSILQLIPADLPAEEGELLFEYTFEAVHLISTRVAHSTSTSPIHHQREQVVNVIERLLRACLNCAAFSTEHKSYLQQHAAAISQLPFITTLSQPKPPAAMESGQVHDLHYQANPPLDLLSPPQDQQALAPLHLHAIDSIARPSPAVPFCPCSHLSLLMRISGSIWYHRLQS